MKKMIAWHILVIAVVTYISHHFRSDIAFKDVEALIAILQNTSAMIFTIMGIWIAYIYPNAVLRIVQPSKVTALYSETDTERVRLLVGIVILSAAILSLLVIGVAAKPFIVKTAAFTSNKEAFTSIGIWGLLALTYAQLFCIYIVIASSVNFIKDLSNLKAKKNLSRKLDGEPNQ
ncbi:hypothetical protein [Aeromonas veronii]|uniref:hypothetical protein n=1 Tax=Aeromonas veronii TaxID=654 RepID=UPI000F602F15|nr:hypothetical protein [Aeromonas veronii]RRA89784.1 hypothetical protein AVS_18980 [Aeromonas veronii bv. sobria]